MTRAQGETPEDRLLRDLDRMDGTGRLPQDRAQIEGQEKCGVVWGDGLTTLVSQCQRPKGHAGIHRYALDTKAPVAIPDPPAQEKPCKFLHQPLPVADPPVPSGQEERRQLLEILYEHCYRTENLVASFKSLAEHKRNLQLTCQSAGIAVGIDGRALDTTAPVSALAQAECICDSDSTWLCPVHGEGQAAQPVPRDEVIGKLLEKALTAGDTAFTKSGEAMIYRNAIREALALLQGAAGKDT